MGKGTGNLQVVLGGLSPVTEAQITREIKAAFKAFCITPLPGDDLDALKRSLKTKVSMVLGVYEVVTVTFDPTAVEVLAGRVHGSVKVQHGRARVIATFQLQL